MKKTVFVLILILGIVFGIFGQTSGPMDLVVILDTSASMSNSYTGTSEYLIGPFLREFLRIGDTFHLISFAAVPRVEISRRVEGVGDVETIIGRLLLMYPLDTESNIGEALTFAENYASSLPGTRHRKLVLITDGDVAATQTLVNESSSRLGSRGADLQYIKVPITGSAPSSGRPAQTVSITPPRQTVQTPTQQTPAQQAAPSASSSQTPVQQPSGQATTPGQPTQTPAQQQAPSASSQTPVQQPPAQQTTPPARPTQTPAQQQAPSASSQTPVQQPSGQATTPRQPTQTPAQQQAPSASSQTPVQQPPAQQTPGQQTIPPRQPAQASAQQAPSASSSQTPTQQTPGQTTPPGQSTQTPAQQQAPVQQAPVQQAPVQQTPGQATTPGQPTQTQTPAQQTPDQTTPPRQPTQTPVQQTPAQQPSRSAQVSQGDIPLPLIIGLAILALLILGFIIFFAARNLHNSPNRVMAQAAAPMDARDRVEAQRQEQIKSAELMDNYAEAQRKHASPPLTYPPTQRKPLPKDKVYSDFSENDGPLMLNLFVEDQNTAIGRRNIHVVKGGYTFSVGGGKSDFLIFLVPVPPHIADVNFDGRNCTFIPRKPQYFPDIGSQQVPACIGKTIRVISDKNYELHIRIERYEDPLKVLNKMLRSISVPGEVRS